MRILSALALKLVIPFYIIIVNVLNTTPLVVYQYLIETLGCDINAQDNNKDNPFHKALEYFNPNDGGDITVLYYLLNQKGVNVNIKRKNSHSLLHTACNNINRIPLDVFKVLIETMGCDVNVQNDDNDTPLHRAFRCFNPNKGGDVAALTYLINQDCINVNIKNEKGFNLLHTTCINNLPSYERSLKLDAECDTVFCQIVEVIVERCIKKILNKTTTS
jgi:ankyrin repeat protein